MGNEVLLTGANCGYLDFSNETLQQYLRVQNPQAQRVFEASREYARACYDGSTIQDCSVFVKPTLQKTMRRMSKCLFEEGMCTDISLQLDSGEIDSLNDLGINSKPEDRFSFRTAVTCSPLTTPGYYHDLNRPEYGPYWGMYRYYDYGVHTPGNNFSIAYPAYVNVSATKTTLSRLNYVMV
jgi:hypothetical protein